MSQTTEPRPLRMRAEIVFPYPDGLVLDGFLPRESDATLSRLADTRFEFALYVDPDRHQGLMPLDVGTVEGSRFVESTGLVVELRTLVDAPLFAEIEAGGRAPETEVFGLEVLAALDCVHDTFIAFVRNGHQQFWLRRRVRTPDEAPQLRLLKYQAEFLHSSNNWRYLAAAGVGAPLHIEASNRIDIGQWAELLDAVSRGTYRARPHMTLVANAFAHLHSGELRAAIIEAVAAWEMVLGSSALGLLAARHVFYDAKKWRRLHNKAGLEATTQLFVAFMHDVDEVATNSSGVADAIKVRNNVVHDGSHPVDRARIARAVTAIRQMIYFCERVRAPKLTP